MSTSGETVRWPQRARRSAIHCGVFALASTPVMTRPEKRPHKSGAWIATGSLRSLPTGALAKVGDFNGAPVIAAASRATP